MGASTEQRKVGEILTPSNHHPVLLYYIVGIVSSETQGMEPIICDLKKETDDLRCTVAPGRGTPLGICQDWKVEAQVQVVFRIPRDGSNIQNREWRISPGLINKKLFHG